MTEPTYDEIYDAVLHKVQNISIDGRASQHAYTQDIMDALAEAYHLGHNNGMKCVATMLVSTEVPNVLPNPYQRTADPHAFL